MQICFVENAAFICNGFCDCLSVQESRWMVAGSSSKLCSSLRRGGQFISTVWLCPWRWLHRTLNTMSNRYDGRNFSPSLHQDHVGRPRNCQSLKWRHRDPGARVPSMQPFSPSWIIQYWFSIGSPLGPVKRSADRIRKLPSLPFPPERYRLKGLLSI
jgi:hypothetical protein